MCYNESMGKSCSITNLLIIPSIKYIEESLSISKDFNTGFEYNDFFFPDTLDNEPFCNDLINRYKSLPDLPSYTTTHGAFFDVLVFSDDSRIREASELRVLQSISIAEKAGCKGIVFHGNINPMLLNTAAGPAYEKHWLETNRSFFSKVCLQHPGLEIYMENMWDYSPDNLASLASEMSDIRNFGLCLDYAHASISPTDTSIWAEKLGPYIKHVHINDNDGKKDLHLALGEGVTDWKRFEELRQKHFADASVLIETSLQNQRKSLEFLRSRGII